MRISQSIITGNAITHLNTALSELYDIEQKGASGKNFSRSSENPTDSSRALSLRTTRDANAAYLSAANAIDLKLATNEQALNELTTICKRALELCNSALPDTIGPDERIAYRNEIRGLVLEVVDVGNTVHNDNYIFNGYQIDPSEVNHLPFEYDDSLLDEPYPGPYTPPVTPSDTGQIMKERFGNGKSVAINVSGEETVKPILEAVIRAYRALDIEAEGQPFDRAELQAAIADINTATVTIKTARTENGARQREVKNAITVMETNDVDIRELLSDIEDANMASVAVELSARQTTYQSVLSVTQKALQLPSLFDYIS